MSDKLTNSNEVELIEVPLDQLKTVVGGTRVNFLVGTPPTIVDNVLNLTGDLVAAVLENIPGALDYVERLSNQIR